MGTHAITPNQKGARCDWMSVKLPFSQLLIKEYIYIQ